MLSTPSDGVDTFLDFSYLQHDLIALVSTGFGLSTTGSLAAADVTLVNGPEPQNPGPTLLYSAGNLSWDMDGTGSQPTTTLAHVEGETRPAVSASIAAPVGKAPISEVTTPLDQLSPADFIII